MNGNLCVVRCEARHHDAVRGICLRTGFLGEDLTGRLEHPSLFLDLTTHYFLEVAREGAFVAEHSGTAVGYIFTVADAGAAARFNRWYYPQRVMRELWRMRALSARDRQYYGAYLRAHLRGEFRFPRLREYPSTLHLNVAPGRQRLGVGGALLAAGLDYLAGAGSPGVQLLTTSANGKMLAFVQRQGFAQLASRPARLYESFGLTGIQHVVYGKKLPASTMP